MYASNDREKVYYWYRGISFSTTKLTTRSVYIRCDKKALCTHTKHKHTRLLCEHPSIVILSQNCI